MLRNVMLQLAQARARARMWRRERRWRRAEAVEGDIVGDIDPNALDVSQDFAFACNICGRAGRATLSALSREAPTCPCCHSNVRTRAMARLVVVETLGRSIALPDLPLAKQVRGLGLSDTTEYADAFTARFDYVNTHFHKRPRLDIVDPDVERYGDRDFVVASDVFEHVPPPVSKAFENAYRLLKPGGKLILSVPFSLDAETVEHFPDLHDWRIDRRGGEPRLVNRAADGTVTVHEGLVFHGGDGATLEMRRFSRAGLERDLRRAGFARVRLCDEPYLPFGIHWQHRWSVPMVAYR